MNMKTKLLAILLLAGSSLFARSHVFFGLGIGGGYPYGGHGYNYYAPPVVAYAPPLAPGPGYSWVDGYYYPYGPRYVWRPGYWARRPYPGAYWIRPRWEGRRYYGGYWRR